LKDTMKKENKITRKCAIYCRVSKDEQNIENQVKALKTYSSQQNYKIFKIYTDVISGTKSSRPALMEMLKDAHGRKFNTVIV